MKNLRGKKILIVIAYQDFQDDEYRVVSEYLGMLGAVIEVASSSIGEARGVNSSLVEVNILINDVNPYQHDALVFIGGPGSVEYQYNETVLELARQFIQSRKIVAAICIAPLILAKAGILSGKHATVWVGYENEEYKELESSGAKYTGEPVTVDKHIITANGPESATKFAEAISKEI